ncbi:MAG: primosomal protein N' [Acetobacteraceae bacterium]|nr:primosomal protein N' [Acetobacteraceae bacterium]
MPPGARKRVRVLLPLPLAGTYDYALPAGMAAGPGAFVVVPLGPRRMIGVIWDGEGDTAQVGDNRLRLVEEVLDAPPMTDSLRRFVDWVAAYTLAPPGAVLRMAMSAPGALEPPAPQAGWRAASPRPEGPRLTPERLRVLEALGAGTMAGGQLAEAAGVSPGVVRGMADHGLLVPALLDRPASFALPTHSPAHLGPEQEAAAEALKAKVAARGFSVSVLSGVTGSGKTEVYLDAIGEALRQGRQTLVLLPEIALSSQWLERFRRRFGTQPALWHSEVASGQRKRTWRAVAEGEAPVLVGARSALFLPFPDLGLVIVDEEHETAFKQEDGVIYNARDMAVVRAQMANAACVLVSATPSLETVANMEAGRYEGFHLPVRHGGAAMPEIRAIDMRATPPERGRFLAPPLTEAIHETLARGEQAMLFLNRRGYAPLTLCRACGHRLQCPNCSAWLVEHRAQRRLQCHHCGHADPIPPQCPECGNEGTLVPVGPGVERIQEEAAMLFPEARRLVMASDTLPGPAAAAEAARQIEEREVDLVIGTQIVAKGWHFPHLTLVGVVDADLGLAGGDLRAAERTMQLLHQVAGRAGRAERPGRVLVQTYAPEHPVMQALVADDMPGFLEAEKTTREPGHWPPYGRLAALIVSSEDPVAADRTARDLGLAAPGGAGIQVLGPAPAPLALLRGRHRRRLLLKAERGVRVQPILREWLARVDVPNDVRVQVDVDPVGFL